MQGLKSRFAFDNYIDNLSVVVLLAFSTTCKSFALCGLARNRTWIWSFGNSYTIHCTTGPVTTFLFTKVADVAAKYFNCNGQQYYTEKFSDDRHAVRA